MPDFPPCSAEADQPVIAVLLRLLRDRLGLEAGFVCELGADSETVRAVESTAPMPLSVGDRVVRRSSLAHQVVTGALPLVCADARAYPAAAELPGIALAGVRTWAAQVVRVGGRTLLVGALALNPRPLPTHAAALVAAIVRELLEPLAAQALRWATVERVEAVLAEGGPCVVAQPLLDLAGGDLLGVEALARFSDGRSPTVWFAEARACGLGVRLELAAARNAATLLDRTAGTVGINLSVAALADPEVLRFLAALPVSRVVVELTEHEEVGDYGALAAALAPLRRRGMGLAVDDAGAGFASLRHVLRLAPDWIKIDGTIVAGADLDPARAALLEALVVFARGAGMRLVAEGVETAGEADLVRRLGVHCGQGWFFGRPVRPAALALTPVRVDRTADVLTLVPTPRRTLAHELAG